MQDPHPTVGRRAGEGSMSDRPSITERYMSARTTSSLKSEASTSMSPSDILMAAGMVGHKHGLAQQLWCVLHTPSRAHLMSLAEKLAVRLDAYMLAKKIHAREHALSISKAVLSWHINGTCRHCGGTGEERIEGTPHLSGVPCNHCNGTRKVPLKTEHDESAHWLCGEIKALEDSAASAMKNKIRR